VPRGWGTCAQAHRKSDLPLGLIRPLVSHPEAEGGLKVVDGGPLGVVDRDVLRQAYIVTERHYNV